MKLKQKIAEFDGKIIAYVETIIEIEGALFTVQINQKQKSLYNYICRNYGFVIGEIKVGDNVEEKVIEI